MKVKVRVRTDMVGVWMTMKTLWVWITVLVTVEGQQSYVNNHQLDCYNHYNTTDGFECNGVASSCLSYLTFRSIPPYNTPTTTAYLLSSDPKLIARANNISDVDVNPIPTNRLIIVPVNCSCASRRRYYQHNASYVLKSRTETYFSVANNTYQGLTTCQSLMSQNPFSDRNLSVQMTLQIPLRCACPTANQTAFGAKYLLSYLVTWSDDIPSIARRFGADPQSVRDANRLSSNDIIYPFTPILVPLTAEPEPFPFPTQLEPSSPPPAPASSIVPLPHHSNKKWVFVGVAVAVAILLLLLGFFLYLRRRPGKAKPVAVAVASSSPPPSASDLYSALPGDSKSWSISSQGVRDAVESLTVYKMEEVERATEFFSEANKIRGSVYRGSFKGDDAAVKVMKGDVSGEINILKRINHSNIIRLSGFCVDGGNTYLVYEYAERGSLSEWLRERPNKDKDVVLGWKQRVEVAHDVADALNYLHNFADPPYIHKNLKSSNILLDANMRAKVSNFGLARATQSRAEDQDQLHLTRHVVGTQGYMAPEYIESGLITPKLDVFALGVLILELLSGREAAANDKSASDSEDLLCHSIARVLQGDNVKDRLRAFMDPALRLDYPFDLAFSMAQLANTCVARHLNSRPHMAQVFMTLSKIRSSTRDWDPSDDSVSTSRSLSDGRY